MALGTRTGVEHQSLIRDASLSLLEGALDLWPDLSQTAEQGNVKSSLPNNWIARGRTAQ